jgi:transposase
LIQLLEKQQIIISAYLEGKSYRSIARETGINRKTVSKYVKEYEEARQKLLEDNEYRGDDKRELIDSIVEKPKYNSQNRQKRKLTAEIIEEIQFHLKENELKRARGQAKQQKKKIDIFEAIEAKGYDISYPTICNTIRQLTQEGAEAHIKAEYSLGDICEFDWGEVKIFIAGELKTLQMAVFTGAKGNYRYARLFTKQDTPCFLESHALFFDYIGGVYKTLVYDNMKVAVKKFVGLTEKEPTESLLKLSIYYGFKFRFCNIRKGNEKGHVERSVEYIRRKSFAFKDEFESLEEANEYLMEICRKLNNKPQRLNDNKTALEILNEEREWLLPKMPMFDAARTSEPRVDKYSTIVVDMCHYSVPDNFVGKIVFTKIYSNKVICYHQGEKIAEHVRKFGFNEWSIKLEHYLKTLKRKPGALASSMALHQADPKLQKIYNQYYIKREKDFIELLHLVSEKGIERIEEAIRTLETVSPLDITTEKVKTICNRQNNVERSDYQNNRLKETDITLKAGEMLKAFKGLIPASDEEFKKEVAII